MYDGLKKVGCRVVWSLRGFELPEKNDKFWRFILVNPKGKVAISKVETSKNYRNKQKWEYSLVDDIKKVLLANWQPLAWAKKGFKETWSDVTSFYSKD